MTFPHKLQLSSWGSHFLWRSYTLSTSSHHDYNPSSAADDDKYSLGPPAQHEQQFMQFATNLVFLRSSPGYRSLQVAFNENVARNTGKWLLCQESNLQQCVAAPSQTESFSATTLCGDSHSNTEATQPFLYIIHATYIIYASLQGKHLHWVPQNRACISMKRLDTPLW